MIITDLIRKHWITLLVFSFLLVYPVPGNSVEVDLSNDDLLKGYLIAILDQQLGWDREDYDLEVLNDRVTILLPREHPDRKDRVLEVLGQIKELKGFHIQVLYSGKADPETVKTSSSLVRKTLHLKNKSFHFPEEDLFKPLLADPKQPRFFMSVRRYDTDVESIASAAVGYGENFGLLRFEGIKPHDGLQLNIDGALFAQFNLDEDSKDLINSDFSIGIPLTYRHGLYSARLRFYHQSSHLGDEFLLRAKPERINLSFESMDLLVSRDWKRWRLYAGGEYLIHREPEDLDRAMLHGGLEYYGNRDVLGLGRLVAGLDLKSYDEHNWSVDASLAAGIHLGESGLAGRYLRIMAEGYKGYAPHGQFYTDRVSYVGLSVSFGL